MPKNQLPDFQRARKPDQIEQRREAILEAALTLLVEEGFQNVSLNDIARKVGSAKSNIYHYFESREHVYLILLQREGASWEQIVTPALEKLTAVGSIESVTAAIIHSFVQSERYCSLICVINSVIEKNISPALVENFRVVFFQRRERFARLIAAALPDCKVEQILPLMLPLFAAISGMWPLSHPPENANSFLDEEEFSYLRVNFEIDMTFFIKTLLKGACA